MDGINKLNKLSSKNSKTFMKHEAYRSRCTLMCLITAWVQCQQLVCVDRVGARAMSRELRQSGGEELVVRLRPPIFATLQLLSKQP